MVEFFLKLFHLLASFLIFHINFLLKPLLFRALSIYPAFVQNVSLQKEVSFVELRIVAPKPFQNLFLSFVLCQLSKFMVVTLNVHCFRG